MNLPKPLLQLLQPQRIVHEQQKRSLFNNLSGKEALALQVDETVRMVRPDSFRGHQAKENVIKAALYPLLGNDQAEVERIFKIIVAQSEY